MTHDEIVEFFNRQQEYWRTRDAEGLARGHAPDGVIISPIFRTVTGASAILSSYRSLFEIFPDWDYRAEDLLIDGDRAAEPFHATATHVGEFMGFQGHGRKFEIQGVRLFEMHGGRIAHERRYYDFTGLLIQLGVLKSKPMA
ncbi:MAG TPA: ester cyclase [Vicinamibacterales bacterium]|nr:ester cyclase [Vicinamibacterales bacterium]